MLPAVRLTLLCTLFLRTSVTLLVGTDRHRHHKEIAVVAEVGSALAPTPAPLTATDIPSIVKRFNDMQFELAGLNKQVTEVQGKIAKAETLAGGATLNIGTAMKTLTSVDAAAKANSKTVAKIGTDATEVGKKVDAATKKMDDMQKTINALQGTARTMGAGSVELGKKLADLDKTIQDTLPGVGTIAKRIDTAEKTLTAYDAEVKKGVDTIVSKELRGMIDGVRGEVRNLAIEVANQGQNKTSNTTLIQTFVQHVKSSDQTLHNIRNQLRKRFVRGSNRA